MIDLLQEGLERINFQLIEKISVGEIDVSLSYLLPIVMHATYLFLVLY